MLMTYWYQYELHWKIITDISNQQNIMGEWISIVLLKKRSYRLLQYMINKGNNKIAELRTI
jgi:hypothetical protein